VRQQLSHLEQKMKDHIIMKQTLKHWKWPLPFHELEFTTMRSRGPGGQNVNKTNSAVQLRWNIWTSTSIPPEIQSRLLEKLGPRLTKEGELLIRTETSRDQDSNRKACIEKLLEILDQALFIPKKRFKTKPTRSSQRKRLETKSKRSEVKKLRRNNID
jgi:ribosome-associated protein